MFQLKNHKCFSLRTGIVSLIGVASLLDTNPASAAIITNGSFENDFTGWETLGSASVRTAGFGSKPTDGSFYAQLDTFLPQEKENFLELANFLELNITALDNLGAGKGEVFEGSAIRTTFTAVAGDVLNFDYNFLTDDYGSEYFNDFAFVGISGQVSGLADTFSVLADSMTPFVNETGFSTYSQTIAASGTYTFTIGVTDVGDGAFDSGLLIDNVNVVRLEPTDPPSVPTPTDPPSVPTPTDPPSVPTPTDPTSVPEPTSILALIAIGALGVRSQWNKDKKKCEGTTKTLHS
ncbi:MULTISPECIES: PEP-CTERM sorting domain-containing protein [Moorena]|uniref:Putative exosortase, PEP-CTERM interaction domain protein n=1 Tax=Moorena producens 3L TaxID=489825 RepID=F4XXL6_9CYAN|nr:MULTISPECIES: PEP-CTERM sorting domain-containing protein [Moorena]EGJ30694.1 putative exosortase, PEP-CTERM interaction domain protein [Moorena producens 3L]NEP33049.1 PEP-CTERM sorting domain-containing protein [Moorena sp. SIO3B2]NEP70304.1 PEP-CTERM sorting domain-containing protein [Moorena sp. SIO3A5]NEQ10166.1 PEP-CTERM sorting domain-containing protein [Moorena sp. SIO4E2]NER90272.1 PEP-CTERM sorting domain-containing protein [Moorena sp. SIO3A2]